MQVLLQDGEERVSREGIDTNKYIFGTKLCNICKLSDIKNQQNSPSVEP